MEREPRETTSSQQAAEIQLTRKGNVATLEKREGKYSIIYGAHAVAADPADLPPDLDGLDLEKQGWTENPLGYLEYCRSSHKQYSSLFPLLEKNKTSVIFTDLTLNNFNLFRSWPYSLPIEISIPVGEYLLAGRISTKKLSRRDILSTGGRIVLAAWLASPFNSAVGRGLSAVTGVGDELTAEYQKLSAKLHPEDFLFAIKFRNYVIAYKQQWLMENTGKKHLGTVIGAGHASIEDIIPYSLPRKYNFLEALAPALPHLVKPAESFYQIGVFNFDGTGWQGEILEVPELKQLMEQAIYSWGIFRDKLVGFWS